MDRPDTAEHPRNLHLKPRNPTITTAAQKAEFITNITASVRDELIAKIPKMPEEWDNHELRQLLADKFAHEVSRLMREKKGAGRKRKKEYDATVYNNNLW